MTAASSLWASISIHVFVRQLCVYKAFQTGRPIVGALPFAVLYDRACRRSVLDLRLFVLRQNCKTSSTIGRRGLAFDATVDTS